MDTWDIETKVNYLCELKYRVNKSVFIQDTAGGEGVKPEKLQWPTWLTSLGELIFQSLPEAGQWDFPFELAKAVPVNTSFDEIRAALPSSGTLSQLSAARQAEYLIERIRRIELNKEIKTEQGYQGLLTGNGQESRVVGF